jgi:hypothetical protein
MSCGWIKFWEPLSKKVTIESAIQLQSAYSHSPVEKPELTQCTAAVNPLVYPSTEYELKDEIVTKPISTRKRKVAAIIPKMKKNKTKNHKVPEIDVLHTSKKPASSKTKSPKKQRGRPKVRGEDQTTCTFCNKEFPTEFQMRRHLVIHKEPNFQCDDCGKRNSSSTFFFYNKFPYFPSKFSQTSSD